MGALHTLESAHMHERFEDRKGTCVYKTFWAIDEVNCLGSFKVSVFAE